MYSEQEVPLISRQDMKPARNTVYGVPFLDQQQHIKNKNVVTSQGDKGFNLRGVSQSLKGSQEFEKTPLRGNTGQRTNTSNQLNIQNVSSESSLIMQQQQ